MRKVILFTSISLDGYIARENGERDWLNNEGGVDYGFHPFFDSVDTVMMGGNTYRQILSFGIDWPYPTKKSYVVTHDASLQSNDEVSFIHHDIPDFVENLKSGSGKDIWLIGGSQLNTLLMANNLIDEMWLFKQPIILGTGIPLFGSLLKDHFFKLRNVAEYENGVLKMVYDHG